MVKWKMERSGCLPCQTTFLLSSPIGLKCKIYFPVVITREFGSEQYLTYKVIHFFSVFLKHILTGSFRIWSLSLSSLNKPAQSPISSIPIKETNNDEKQRGTLCSWEEEEIKVSCDFLVHLMVLTWALSLNTRRIGACGKKYTQLSTPARVGLDDPYLSSGSRRYPKEFLLLSSSRRAIWLLQEGRVCSREEPSIHVKIVLCRGEISVFPDCVLSGI